MEIAIITLVPQFKDFAGKEGLSHTASKDNNLLTSQLPIYTKILSLEPWMNTYFVRSVIEV